MGSAGSRSAPPPSSTPRPNGGARRARSRAHRVLQSSCLGTTSRSRHCHDDHQVCDGRSKGNGVNAPPGSLGGAESCHGKVECYRKAKVGQCNEIPCISSNEDFSEWSRANIGDAASTIGSSSGQATNPSNRFLSRFSLTPGAISFRLSRANSLGSSRSYPVSSTSLMLNGEDDGSLQTGPVSGSINRDERQHGSERLPSSAPPSRRAPTLFCEDTSENLRVNTQANYSVNSIDPEASSYNQDVDANTYLPRNNSETENVAVRVSDRLATREPIDRNVRFSRTLSVGRLRDRVLRRTSLPDISFCPVQQEVGDSNQTRSLPSDGNEVVPLSSSSYASSSISSSLFGIHDYEVETSRSREPRYHDLLEHRSNFLERRRRIRSQVRALQRLGSRFENLSGHERACILSGQHRTGRCTCRTNNRDSHLNDDTSARASISRIVMLAEALFEVLDEIHQQSVVLSTRPSVSSIGSVPAPIEVVESLPVKLYRKLQKHQNEEAAQCYICLVEYEDGDRMRTLPCHHEFHKTCVDKWLKEIHRVCPLCRGDICRPDSLPVNN